MSNLLPVFLNNILPIFLAAGAGALLGKTTTINPGSLSKVVVYLFVPCLFFRLMLSNPMSNTDILKMMGFTLVLMTMVATLMGGIGVLMRWDKSIIAAAVLTSLATNAGNYGLSVNKFAFGDVALPYASVYMVTNSLVTYTLGIMVVAWGTQRAINFTSVIVAPLRYPIIPAFVLGLVFSQLQLSLPLPVDRVVTLFSDAAIPTMLVVLGLQIGNTQWSRPNQALFTSNVIRLVASPIIAIALAALFALHGPARQAGILQASMPTAVTATVLATEFDLQPSFVTVTVALSTLLSIITLTPLIGLLS